MDSVLYVWIRTDLDSMNTGKACAQVAHAASQAAWLLKNNSEYKEWESSASDEAGVNCPGANGFGTTIVLDGGSGDNLRKIWDLLRSRTDIAGGIVTDPSYPVRDGNTTWKVEADTCVWILVSDSTNDETREYIKGFNLR